MQQVQVASYYLCFTFTGWVGGFTNTNKSKKVSVYDHNWKRLIQAGLKQVKLVRRSNKLCVV